MTIKIDLMPWEKQTLENAAEILAEYYGAITKFDSVENADPLRVLYAINVLREMGPEKTDSPAKEGGAK